MHYVQIVKLEVFAPVTGGAIVAGTVPLLHPNDRHLHVILTLVLQPLQLQRLLPLLELLILIHIIIITSSGSLRLFIVFVSGLFG